MVHAMIPLKVANDAKLQPLQWLDFVQTLDKLGVKQVPQPSVPARASTASRAPRW